MCARYCLVKDLTEVITRVLGLDGLPKLSPRYNLAPRQIAPVIVQAGGRPACKFLRWGLVPAWADDERVGAKMINARAETVAEKPAFRQAFKARRCLVPADGFYEWENTAAGKEPRRFTMADDRVFCFAGLWERWRRPAANPPDLFRAEGDPAAVADWLETFAIITTEANDLVRPVHVRMPVILPASEWRAWLDPDSPREALRALLRPFPSAAMRAERVSRRLNNPRFEGRPP